MADRRNNDTGLKSYFRSERLFEEQGQWYFYTREGVEGPFGDRFYAANMIKTYIHKMQLRSTPILIFSALYVFRFFQQMPALAFC